MNMEPVSKALQINYSFWILQIIAMMATGWLVPKLKITNPLGAVLMVVALAFVNSHIWDAALFFEIPDSFTSRSITLLIANGVIFWILVKVLPWIEIHGILAPIVAPIVFTVMSLLCGYLAKNVDWGKTANDAIRNIGQLKSTLEKAEPKAAEPRSLLYYRFNG